jgi:hypothetical protein
MTLMSRGQKAFFVLERRQAHKQVVIIKKFAVWRIKESEKHVRLYEEKNASYWYGGSDIGTVDGFVFNGFGTR